MSKSCLIGYTGFVGVALLQDIHFSALINRTNLHELRNKWFDTIICTALPAEKWKANSYPVDDRANLMTLIEALEGIRADRFILVSTVDIYQTPVSVSEGSPFEVSQEPYGLHRYELECFVRSKFKSFMIIRLPALFGPRLKKNILFDLINCRLIDTIDERSEYQWYPVSSLASDIRRLQRVLFEGVINLCPEPLPTSVIVKELFPGLDLSTKMGEPKRYDVRTVTLPLENVSLTGF